MSPTYPNVVAELAAGMKFNFIGVGSLADAISVTPALAQAIIDGREAPTREELVSLLCALNWAHIRKVPLGYLLSQKPAQMPVAPWRLKRMTESLRWHMDAALYCSPSGWYLGWKQPAQSILTAMESGEPVTYAQYRNAMIALAVVICSETERKAPRRDLLTKESVV